MERPMDQLMSDLGLALRRIVRERSVTLVALVTLGFGIGANTAVFSLIETVMLRPLPYAQPERVIVVWNAVENGETTWLSAREILSYRQEATSLDQVAAYTRRHRTSPAVRSRSASGLPLSRRTSSTRWGCRYGEAARSPRRKACPAPTTS